MAKIPGYVFMIIGGLLSLISFSVNKSQNSNSLTIFIYVGYLFMAYGVARVLINFILKNEKSRDKKIKANELPEDLKIMDKTSKMLTGKKDLYGYIGYCPKCGTPMRRINVFCHRCGLKQKIA